jgi:hypothetical protein
LVVAGLLSVGVSGVAVASAQADPRGEMGVERYLNSVRHDWLRAFLLDLPKGGDLHSHLSGAASTELLISLAAQDGLCIDAVTFVAAAGCAVTLRYIQQVNRNSPPNVVFTYMVSAFDLAAADKRTMALNLVSSDEGEVSIRDYRLHMRMLDYLRGVYPTGHITLDAGVDVLDEDGWPRLMRTMPIGM